MAIDFTKPVRTKGGESVRILCTDGPAYKYPVIGIIHGYTSIATWTSDGFFEDIEDPCEDDLENITEEDMHCI